MVRRRAAGEPLRALAADYGSRIRRSAANYARTEVASTLEEIGRRLGLTWERIRQIQVEALRRLASLREIQAVPH